MWPRQKFPGYLDGWRQQGIVCCWKTRDGWNITADADGCHSMCTLLDKMAAEQWPCSRTIELVRPYVVTNGDHVKFRPVDKLEFLFKNHSVAAGFWSLAGDVQKVTLTFGEEKLLMLKNMFLDIAQGGGDYIVERDPDLWAWWFVRGMCDPL